MKESEMTPMQAAGLDRWPTWAEIDRRHHADCRAGRDEIRRALGGRGFGVTSEKEHKVSYERQRQE